jgi:hypothetical protein
VIEDMAVIQQFDDSLEAHRFERDYRPEQIQR